MNTDHVKLELSVEEVNLILEALGRCPFHKVYRLIARLQKEAQAQLTRESEAPQ